MEVPSDADGEHDDVNMVSNNPFDDPADSSQEPANKKPSRSQIPSSLSREASVEMASDNDSYALSHTANQSSNDGSSTSSTTAISQTLEGITGKTDSPPSLEEQIATIQRLSDVPTTEGMIGYVISNQWLEDAQERGSGSKKSEASIPNEVLPPVDNRDLLKPVDASWDGLVDEKQEPFVPLKPGLSLGQEIEILTYEAWSKIIAWHGLAAGSPEIRRYCHNTTTAIGSENFAFELYPPVFTVMKLVDPNATGADVASERGMAPAKVLAPRSERLAVFTKRAKAAARVAPDEEVRLWKVIGTLADASQQPGMITPAQSRSASPAPTSLPINLANKLVVELRQFAGLENGSKRELVDTAGLSSNPAPATLDTAGLGQEGIIILDTRVKGPAGGEWLSDAHASSTGRHGAKLLAEDARSKSNFSSGRSSPVPGMQTRGRAQRMGRTRGTSGLMNLGNTCYMNSALQCVKSVKELTTYFLDDRYKAELNPDNPLAHNGDVAREYAKLLKQMFAENATAFSPRQFKTTIGRYGASFSGYGQQDSQEFLLFLLDGLQEDLNRIHKKPYIEKPDSTDEMVHDENALRQFAARCWEIYKARNDSVITDLFAGMYKSTVKCPVCDKVSIIFDPFNNLTLQLPVENVWARRIIYHPLYLPAIDIDIDIDKNSTFGQVKEFIASRVQTDPRRIVFVEIYSSRIYRMFNDNTPIIEERLQPSDILVAFELDEIPTNYPDPRPPKQRYSNNFYNEQETPEERIKYSERLLVPIFHRQPKENVSREAWTVFAYPSYITLTEEEAKDEDLILRKVLARVATMTTLDILEQANDSEDESDAVIMSTEDADSSDSHVKAQSIQGEEGMVDVSMRDSDEDAKPRISFPPPPRIKKSLPTALQPGRPLGPALKNLFEMKAFGHEEFIPIAWNKLGTDNTNIVPLSERRPRAPKRAKAKAAQSAGEQLKKHIANGGSSTESSDDELSHDPAPASNDVDSTDDELPPVEPLTAPTGDLDDDVAEPQPTPERVPLVRLREAIVCDWQAGAVQSLFSEDALTEKDNLRGAPTWNAPRPLWPDPATDHRRTQRTLRKRRGVTLDDCLEEFGKEEILSANDAWYCPRCKEHRRASKKFELWKVPDILVIHLKRFSVQGRLRDKLDLVVEFPLQGLDLTQRVADSDGKELIFDLFAVDNHYGGLGGGHYTAYAKSFIDECWYDYNDATATTQNDLDRVNSSAAYLLFYRRRSATPLGGPFFEQPPDSDGESDSASGSPASRAGEGRRLDGSSRTGSSSGYPAAGAARPAGGGGPEDDEDDEALPPYARSELPVESMEMDSVPRVFGGPVVTWDGFGQLSAGAHGPDGEDNLSTAAVDDDDDDRSMRSAGGADWAPPGTPQPRSQLEALPASAAPATDEVEATKAPLADEEAST